MRQRRLQTGRPDADRRIRRRGAVFCGRLLNVSLRAGLAGFLGVWAFSLVPLGEAAILQSPSNPSSPSSAAAHATAAEKAISEHNPKLAEKEWSLAAALAQAEMGDVLLREGLPAKAMPLFQNAVSSLGITKPLALGLARAYEQTGKPADGIEYLQKALNREPKDFELRRALGEALAASGQTAAALTEFQRALRLNPKDKETLYMAGSSALKLNKLAQARGFYAALCAAAPGAACPLLVGRLYHEFGYTAESASELKTALRLDPRIKRAHYFLGAMAIEDEGNVHLDEARSQFQQELMNSPDDFLSNLYLGKVLVLQRQFSEAEVYLQKAISIVPSSPDAFANLADCYFGLKQYEQAEAAALKAIALTPDQASDQFRIADTHYVLAQSLRKLGQPEKADQEIAIAQRLKQEAATASRSDLKTYLDRDMKSAENETRANPSVEWLTNDPDEQSKLQLESQDRLLDQLLAQIRFNLGVLYLQEHRSSEAVAQLAELEQSQPDYPGLDKAYGAALLYDDKSAMAIPFLREALNSSPEDDDLRRLLGQAYSGVSDYANTVAVLQGHSWHDLPTQYAFATALARTGQDGPAAEVFDRLLAEHPDSADLQVLLGKAAAKEKDYEGALSRYRRALEIDPAVHEAHTGIALIEMRNGQLGPAQSELRLELGAHPDDTRAKFYLAYVLTLAQNREEADKLLREILSAHPDFADAHATLGAELLAEDKPSEALDELSRAEALAPRDAKVAYQLGVAYRKLGKLQEAEKEFARSRKIQKQAADQERGGGMGSEDGPHE